MKLPKLLEGPRRKIVEALGGSLLGDRGTATSDEDIGFRPLSDRGKNRNRTRDLTILSQKESIDGALYLYHTNALAEFIVDMPISLVVGQELGYAIAVNADQAKKSPEEAKKLTEAIRKELDKFWYHPAHDISTKAPEYARTFLVTGHLVLPVTAVNFVDGVPQFDLIDAAQMSGVLPKNGSAIVPGVVKFRPVDIADREEGMLVLQRNVDGLLVPTQRQEDGVFVAPDEDSGAGVKIVAEGLYFRHNKLLNSMRGVSYLMPVADWLDALDQFVWASLHRAKLRNAIVWHLKMNGVSDPAKIAAAVQEVLSVIGNPGTVYGSNDATELEAKAAELGAGETVELGRMILTHILGSKNIPESWYSQGGNANRSTASEQTDVSYKALQVMQSTFRSIFRTMLWVAYDSIQSKQSALFPKRTETPWLTIEPNMPVVQERDMSRMAAAAAQLVSGLGLAVQDRLISERTSRRTFLDVLGQITGGAFELDVEEAAIESEEEKRQQREAQAAADAARLIAQQNLGRKGKGGPEGGSGNPPGGGGKPPKAPPSERLNEGREREERLLGITEQLAEAAARPPATTEIHQHTHLPAVTVDARSEISTVGSGELEKVARAGQLAAEAGARVAEAATGLATATQHVAASASQAAAAATAQGPDTIIVHAQAPVVLNETKVEVAPTPVTIENKTDVHVDPPGATVSEQVVERNPNREITKTTTTTRPVKE